MAPRAARGVVLVLRVLFGLFSLGAAFNKFQRNYLVSDYPLKTFTARLAELEPGSFGAWNLEHLIIPNYQLIGWIVAWGELAVAAGMLTTAAARRCSSRRAPCCPA